MFNPVLLTAQQCVDLEQIGARAFRSQHNLANMAGITYGGQLLALAIRAAQRTVDDGVIHHCTGYFLQKVSRKHALEFSVEQTRDGGQFTMRRVIARQHGVHVFDLFCSFHAERQGLSHQVMAMGDQPQPQEVPSLSDVLGAREGDQSFIVDHLKTFPIETRTIDPRSVLLGDGEHADVELWLRVPSAETIDDPATHACLVALVSDWWTGIAPFLRHALDETAKRNLQSVTINHSMWFHRQARADEWLMVRASSPWAANGRGLSSGTIFDREGKVVATISQEVAMGSRG